MSVMQITYFLIWAYYDYEPLREGSRVQTVGTQGAGNLNGGYMHRIALCC